MKRSNWAIGESVVVKPGVKDPDTGRDIGGWQGRISAILDGAQILTIRWDSLTLGSMPEAFLAWSEEEGLSWSEMNLSPEEVESAAARDTEDDVAAATAELESQTSWQRVTTSWRCCGPGMPTWRSTWSSRWPPPW